MLELPWNNKSGTGNEH